MRSGSRWFVSLLVVGLVLVGCDGKSAARNLKPLVVVSTMPASSATNTLTSLPSISTTLPPPLTLTPIPSDTPSPTITPSPQPTVTPTPTSSPTATPMPACNKRHPPTDDLLVFVSRQYGLAPDYAPTDLVLLSDYVTHAIHLGYNTEIRAIMAEPTAKMIDDMQTVGLAPTIISGYRSYADQQTAWNKWITKEPERGAILSAKPGHSEHQLGTTLDFGSPELPAIVGEEKIQFHTYFYQTSEGKWLAEHAHEYGFSLSYPREAFALTEFYYEPWHYRFIGVEMAVELKNAGISLTEWHVNNNPIPCLKDEG